MFDFLKKGMTLKRQSDGNEESPTHFHSTRNENMSTEELAQLVLLDTVNRNGIPRDWLRVECLEVTHRSGLKQTQLQLVMRRWSDQLLHYSAALQQQFLAGLDHFEPGVDHSSFAVSWYFAKDCAMPSALIPEDVAWHVSSHRLD
jgi:hypothetical protein